MCMYMFVSVDRLTTTHTHGQHNTPQQPQKHSPPPLPRPAALPARALEPVRQRVQRHGLLGGHRALPGAGHPQVRLVFGCGGAWIYLFRLHIERPVLNTVPFIHNPPPKKNSSVAIDPVHFFPMGSERGNEPSIRARNAAVGICWECLLVGRSAFQHRLFACLRTHASSWTYPT